jgi:hypothetical protein
MDSPTRLCQHCEKPLRGRTDKKFCDDYCRNAFNNKQNSDQSNLIRNINNILRRNRRILQSAIPTGEGMAKTTRTRLNTAGFEFTYFTHQYLNKKGDTYRFCYDYGYLQLEGDWLLIVQRKEPEAK